MKHYKLVNRMGQFRGVTRQLYGVFWNLSLEKKEKINKTIVDGIVRCK